MHQRAIGLLKAADRDAPPNDAARPERAEREREPEDVGGEEERHAARAGPRSSRRPRRG